MNSRLHHPARVALAATALVGVLTATACGSSSKTSSSTSATTSVSTPSASAVNPSSSAAASTASSTSATPSATPTKTVKKTAVTSADAVTVTGAFGKAPTVKGPYPFAINKTQSKVLVHGTGATVTRGAVTSFNYDGIDATTGKSFDSSFAKGRTPLTMANTGLIPGFTNSIVGKKVGDRILMVINSKDGYDPNGQGDIKPGDTLIFVVDVVGTTLPGPTGAAVTPAAGLPTVGKDAKGFPTLTIDTSKAMATKDVVQPLTTGTGDVVKATDTVVVHYRAYNMKSGQLMYSDYEGDVESAAVQGLLQSWQKAMVGKKVGSRLLVISANPYPNGNATPSIAAGDNLAFIIDVLNAFPTPAQQ